ncbi:MAG: epoxyqueuosine reductase, partial [Enterobacterales bacterium]
VSKTLAPFLATTNDCGNCVACLKICPTQAIIEPYVVDARRCISYFTIESSAAIPLELRPLMGNRIYGCDDCQLICPWNKYAKLSLENDFQARNQLDQITLLELFEWSEEHFLSTLEGSPIRRIGFESWQRNISVALGNAPYDKHIVEALNNKLSSSSELVSEHIEWALEQQNNKKEHLVGHLLGDLVDTSVVNMDEKLNLKLIRAVEVSMPRDA